jgi:ribosomal protein L14E/L6E/L27E
MKTVFSLGDLVLSKAGRDAGEVLLVVDVDDEYVKIVDGKRRKVLNPKKKKIKHIEKFLEGESLDLAIKIKSGQPVSNERVIRAIRNAKQKIQED